MARIRSVHPGWFTDEVWVSVSMAARLFGIGVWSECDDYGAFEWKPITLKMRIFPADNIDVPALLAELEEADLIRRYEVGGKVYGAVRNFGRFQRPKKPKSIYPMLPELRTYAASDGGSSELGGSEAGRVPPTGELAAQMEDGEEDGEGEEDGGQSGAGAIAREGRPPVAERQGTDELGPWLRSLVGTEPVLHDLKTQSIAELLDEGLTRADVEAGIGAAMADPGFRPRSWKSLVGWIRRAAKDRLEAAPKVRPGRSPDAPTPLPDPVQFRRVLVARAADHFRGKWRDVWPNEHMPDHPDCQLSEDMIAEARAIVDAEEASKSDPEAFARLRGFVPDRPRQSAVGQAA